MSVIMEETDELLLAQTEIRHLKNTIQALREEMERVRFERDEAVSAAVSEANKEIQQLRSTALAFRDDLERSEQRRVGNGGECRGAAEA